MLNTRVGQNDLRSKCHRSNPWGLTGCGCFSLRNIYEGEMHVANLGLESFRSPPPPPVHFSARRYPNVGGYIMMQSRLCLGRRRGRENLCSPPVSLREELQQHRRGGLFWKVSTSSKNTPRVISSERFSCDFDEDVKSVVRVSEHSCFLMYDVHQQAHTTRQLYVQDRTPHPTPQCQHISPTTRKVIASTALVKSKCLNH